MQKFGILVMAYGSPDSLDEMEPYLLDVRGGRYTSPALIEEIKERYALIGGRSPLLDLTRHQAEALEAEMNRRFSRRGLVFKSYVGMRHWQPRIRQAVAEMAADGIRQALALVMAPHSSRMSTGAYFARLDEAIAESGADITAIRIEGWHTHPGLIEALAEKANARLNNFENTRPFVLFTAHSLPARILSQGDPYDAQLHETAGLLAECLGLAAGRWRFCYQSAGQSQEPWLGPPVEQVVVELASQGETNILVVPVGFMCDHVEVLYDIDIVCRKLAADHGARLERSESLNVSPVFVQALADILSAAVERSAPQEQMH
jgi:protoporphyrin/coproporphyrin ferrochelatase